MNWQASRFTVSAFRTVRGGAGPLTGRAAGRIGGAPCHWRSRSLIPPFHLSPRSAALRLFGTALLVSALAGCAQKMPPAGIQLPHSPQDEQKMAIQLLARNHQAEESLCYTSHEVNQQLVNSEWPSSAVTVSGGRTRATEMYSRPVTTEIIRTECGPQQKRFEVVRSDAPGASSAGMVVVQNGARGWRYVPAAHRIDLLTFPSTNYGPFNWLALVLANYDVENIHPDRVAGAPAWSLELRPREPGRPMKRLWLDARTYLALRQELWGPAGHLISATQVVAPPVVHDAPDLADFGPPQVKDPGIRVVRGDEDWRMPETMVHSSLGYPLGQITVLPKGFRPVGTYLHICTDTLGPCARWELSDGVATVNVIQTRMNMDDFHGIDTPQDVQGPIATVQRGPFHFIVRGNLPRRELRRIADNITLTSNH